MPPEPWDPFVSEFSLRCSEIYDFFRQSAVNTGREVTFMIAMASAGFVVPFERMQMSHPARDVDIFKKAKSQFDALMKQKFIGSMLCPNRMDHSVDWRYAKSEELPGRDESILLWLRERANKLDPLSSKKEVGSLLKHVRNSLAHGNIFSNTGDRIDQLIFLNLVPEKAGFCHILSVHPNSFHDLLIRWFEFTKSISDMFVMPVFPRAYWEQEEDDEDETRSERDLPSAAV